MPYASAATCRSGDEPYDRSSARAAVAAVMPAFELIEDRKAVYKETKALSLIADNAWNGGIVLGAEHVPAARLRLERARAVRSPINGVATQVAARPTIRWARSPGSPISRRRAGGR